MKYQALLVRLDKVQEELLYYASALSLAAASALANVKVFTLKIFM